MDESLPDKWFPDEWLFLKELGPNSASCDIRCFEIRDYEQFPGKVLQDYDLFIRLVLTLRHLSHALSAIVFMEEDIEWENNTHLVNYSVSKPMRPAS